ncbi:MAG: RNA polymerase sigma factor [Anaerolineales bacterium]
MTSRSTDEWLATLRSENPADREAALLDLREFLLRAAIVYLDTRRGDLRDWSPADVRSLAEELTQQSVVDVEAQLDSFRGEARFTTWAYRFVVNRAATELRRRRYRDISLDWLREEGSHAVRRALAQDEAVDPARAAEQQNYVELLYDIIAHRLTERQRLAIVSVYLMEVPMDSVAETLGLSRNSLYKLLHDGRKAIKRELLARHLTQGDLLTAFGDGD